MQSFMKMLIVFSCLFSELGGNMNESVSASVTRLLQAFQAKEVETLKRRTLYLQHRILHCFRRRSKVKQNK